MTLSRAIRPAAFLVVLLLAFGLVGTLLTVFQLAGPAVTFAFALASRASVRARSRSPSSVDYVARSSEATNEGDAVIIEEYEDSEVVVSRAPAELKLEA